MLRLHTKNILTVWVPLLAVLVLSSNSCSLLSKSKKEATQASAQVDLGRQLYFDKNLSLDASVSCNSCHDVTKQQPGIDGLPVSVGIKNQKGGRNSPTVWNSKFWSVQFWDGRAASLSEQSLGPITNPIEMGMPSHQLAVERIAGKARYQELFAASFPADSQPVSVANMVTAIAKFEESLVALNSRWDNYNSGNHQALNELELKGWQKFQNVGCVSCHSGAHFNGPTLPQGQGFYMKFPLMPNAAYEKRYGFSQDLGRSEVTKSPSDKNLWRVPSLRNVAVTAPYFHNGAVKDLKEAIRVMGKTQLGMDLTAEDVNSIEAFLKTLTSEFPVVEEPTPL